MNENQIFEPGIFVSVHYFIAIVTHKNLDSFGPEHDKKGSTTQNKLFKQLLFSLYLSTT